ncbi:tetraacyldisaccharide 4'-kinase [Amphritea opalescens]|uniref:Tetraacyldisaccharide 4'-kinase n=1 Tax=Amphritea opalescens TaxID=2490544 RepID=A0A430KQU9_9GAMM|nr:tetraacyldisaccharide 4'-kinase [Amphritea opalescens]RTE65723.1 tetraacyldisaccharide 4'-kinase [Amphritea opalescens]
MGLEQAWYNGSRWPALLRPLERLFRCLATRRRQQYLDGIKARWTAPVPVIVVGNISVGGTGKSPLVIWLIEHLRTQGYSPGVISRGYRASPPTTPYFVTAAAKPSEAGDEPLMIVRRTGVPLVISADRVAAAKHLLTQAACDLIISDDGLQHYALDRTVEIAVIDGARGFGNRRCLPEGPLREPVERLNDVDLIVVNGNASPALLESAHASKAFQMTLEAGSLVSLSTHQVVEPSAWRGPRQVNAVAAIGNPVRFAQTLASLGFTPQLHPFADHHQYSRADVTFAQPLPLIMTEKDAVKCDHLGLDDAWYLQVNAMMDKSFSASLEAILNTALSADTEQNSAY